MSRNDSFRRTLRDLGYRLRKRRGVDLFDLIDISKNYLVLADSTIEDIAAHIADLHFPAPGGDADD